MDIQRDQFTGRQYQFINHMIKLNNATQAAEQAGYSKQTARQQGSRLMKIPEIAEQVRAGQAKYLDALPKELATQVTKLKRKDNYIAKLISCINEIQDPNSGAKAKYVEMLGKALGHFNDKESGNIFVNIETLSPEEREARARAILSKIHTANNSSANTLDIVCENVETDDPNG